MITLAKFGPAFGLSDPSPFVMKAEILLKMAGQPYRSDDSMAAFRRAPKGKLPYIVDDGVTVADSTFIRLHLERAYGIDFDAGLSAPQRAAGWAFERLAEDHLYWAMAHARWFEPRNFAILKAQFLTMMPPVIGPAIVAKARRNMWRQLHGHGLARHVPEEIHALAARDLAAIADALGDKPFFFGPEPKGVDATLGALLAGILCDAFDSPVRRTAEERGNLVAYRDRILQRFYAPVRLTSYAA